LFFIGGYPSVTRAEAMISTYGRREYFNIDGRLEWLKRYAGLYLRTQEGGYDDRRWKWAFIPWQSIPSHGVSQSDHTE
jgi:hypothetical protein